MSGPEKENELEDLSEESSGVQAAETGARILNSLATLGPAPMLKSIAKHAGMPPAKAHRYLVSFLRSGLVTRDPQSGRYLLGPLAVRLGLAALRRLDIVKAATPMLAPLRDEVRHSVFLAVWSENGPTVVRTEELDDPLIIATRVGSVLPILPSATGRLFGAYLPRSVTAGIIARDFDRNPEWKDRYPDLDALFDEVHTRGIARTLGELNPGIFALSAPIFNHDKRIVGALTAVGVAGSFNADWDSPTATKLRNMAHRVSVSMGYDEGPAE